VGIDGPDLASVSQLILLNNLQWGQLGALIEGVRVHAKSLIRAASSVEEIVQIYSGVTWIKPEDFS